MSNTNVVESIIKTPVESNLLKYAAGQAIFCPNCDRIMDWRDTVIATIHATRPGSEVKDANSKLADKGINARVEIVDGRDHRFDD